MFQSWYCRISTISDVQVRRLRWYLLVWEWRPWSGLLWQVIFGKRHVCTQKPSPFSNLSKYRIVTLDDGEQTRKFCGWVFFTSQPLHCGSFSNQQWLREIRPFAPNFQRKPSFRSKILRYHCHFWFNLGTSWILAIAAQESIDLIGWWEDGLQKLGTG